MTTYGIIEEVYSIGENTRKAYGVAVYADADKDGTATIIASIHDVTADESTLKELVDLCNSLDLSLCHFVDVIENFIVC